MLSLKELTSKIIIKKRFDRRNLNNDVRNYLNKMEFDSLLSKLKYEDTQGRDFHGFPQNKLIAMLDHKHHIQINIRGYEKNTLCLNIHFPRIRYMLYYLQQEDKYLERYPQKCHMKRCDYHKCIEACTIYKIRYY